MSSLKSSYLETEIQTANSLELTARLLQRLKLDIHRVQNAFEEDAVEDAVEFGKHGMLVIEELKCSLDLESPDPTAKEIASHMLSLYSYWGTELLQAHRDRDPGERRERLERLVRMVSQIEEGWRGASEKAEPGVR